MLLRTMIRTIALGTVLSLGFAGAQAQAAFIGSLGLNGNDLSIMSGPGLADSTMFTVGVFTGNGNTTGGFNGQVPTLTPFSGSTLTLGSATGFTFSNATVGTFTQTSAAVLTSVSTIGGIVNGETFYILGTYAGGPVGSMAVPSSFTISFTQNGGPGNSVSGSGTLTIPPTGIVPEPASVVMMGLGLLAVGGYGLRSRFVS